MIASVVAKGASALSIDFFTKDAGGRDRRSGGGIAHAIVGSAIIVGIATAMALPIGVLIAIFLTEFSTPRTGATRSASRSTSSTACRRS